MAPCYFLLYCEEDLSFAVVPASDVVFKTVPKKDEEVVFYYDSSKRAYSGKVIEFGENEESFASLVKLQNQLNSQSREKRQKSFDASQPRKAAVKQKAALKQLLSTVRKTKNTVSTGKDDTNDTTRIASEKSKENDRTGSDTGGVSDTSNEKVNTDSDDDLVPVEKVLNKKRQDELALKNLVRNKRDEDRRHADTTRSVAAKTSTLSSSGSSSGRRSNVANINVRSELENRAGHSSPPSAGLNNILNEETAGNAQETNPTGPSPPSLRSMCVRIRRARSARSNRKVQLIEFKGLMFKHNNVDNDQRIIELYEGSGVYISKPELSTLKSKVKSASQVARALMDGIFTTEAMLECSLQGELSTSGETFLQRTSLDRNAVGAILDFAVRFAARKNLKQQELAVIKHSMSSKLNELRYAYRLNTGLMAGPSREDERSMEEHR